MRIHKEHTSAIVIDIQERLFPHIHENKVLEKNVNLLIQGLNLLKIPVIVTEQYRKGLGPTIESVSGSLIDFHPIEKLSFSCCDESKFLKDLMLKNSKHVIIAGIEAHVCVLQTVIDLVDNGFHPVVVEDCVSSRKANDKHMAIERMRSEGAVITTYESILLEICRVAGNDTFKAISQLIK